MAWATAWATASATAMEPTSYYFLLSEYIQICCRALFIASTISNSNRPLIAMALSTPPHPSSPLHRTPTAHTQIHLIIHYITPASAPHALRSTHKPSMSHSHTISYTQFAYTHIHTFTHTYNTHTQHRTTSTVPRPLTEHMRRK